MAGVSPLGGLQSRRIARLDKLLVGDLELVQVVPRLVLLSILQL